MGRWDQDDTPVTTLLVPALTNHRMCVPGSFCSQLELVAGAVEPNGVFLIVQSFEPGSPNIFEHYP
jgi:hypothetical protein